MISIPTKSVSSAWWALNWFALNAGGCASFTWWYTHHPYANLASGCAPYSAYDRAARNVDKHRLLNIDYFPWNYLFSSSFYLKCYYTPAQRSPPVCQFVRPSVRLWTKSCLLCIFHNTSQIHFIFRYLINQLQKVCCIFSFVKNLKFEFLAISEIYTFNFVLCSFNMNVKNSSSEFLLQNLFNFLWWYLEMVWPKLQFCIFGIFFFNCTFSPSVCGGIKDNIDSSPEFLLQSLWMAWNCWCVLTTLGTDYILIIICWFSSFWWHFDLVKQAKFAISRHFVENIGRNGLKFGMFIYSVYLQSRVDFGLSLLIFLILAPFWLSETGQIWNFLDFLKKAWEEWPNIWHADISWPPLELITFGSWFVRFPHFGTILTS